MYFDSLIYRSTNNFDRLTVGARNTIIRDRSAALLAGDIRALWSDLFPELVVTTPRKEPSDNNRSIQKLLRYHRFSDAQHLIDQSGAPVPLDDKVIKELKNKINPSCVINARPCKDVPLPTSDEGPNSQLFDYDDDDDIFYKISRIALIKSSLDVQLDVWEIAWIFLRPIVGIYVQMRILTYTLWNPWRSYMMMISL